MFALAAALLPAARGAGLRVGQAVVDLTPPPLMPFHAPQRPPFPAGPAEGVHDPLLARAVVFEVGGVKAAVVACDLTSIPRHLHEEARAHVSRISRVPPAHVMFSATHTHTTPNIRPRFARNATPEQRQVMDAYLARLPQLMAESVQAAEARLSPATLQATIGEVRGVAFNRRFLMKDGTVVSNPAKGRDEGLVDVVRAAGPTDPSLPMLYFAGTDGRPIATLLNFAMHLDTTGGQRYSADFPHQIAKILRDVKGPEMLMHFTMGAAGNVNHYYLLDPHRPHRVKGYDESARIGTLIAAEVVRGYAQLRPVAVDGLKVSHETVSLVLHEAKAAAVAAQFGGGAAFHDGEVGYRLIDGQYRFEAEVMVIALGEEVAFVGFPGEMFVELGLMVKQGSPYQYTFIDTLANGAIGYVANRKAYREGSYGASVATTRSQPGSGEALVDSALRQLIALRDMKPTP